MSRRPTKAHLVKLNQNLVQARKKIKAGGFIAKIRGRTKKHNAKGGAYITRRGGKKTILRGLQLAVRKHREQTRIDRNKGSRTFLKPKTYKKRGGQDESTDDLANLIEDFRSLVTQPLLEGNQGTDEQGYYEACEAIIEGFQNIGASAEEMSSRIGDHIRESMDEDYDPDGDPRFELGSFFEGIARDAGACLDRIISFDEDGEPYFNEGVDPDTALEDLQIITSDFERGITAMDELG